MKKIIYLLLLMVIVSCSQYEQNMDVQNVNDDLISYKENMLVFSDSKVLENVLMMKQEIPNNLSFISQKQLFDQVVKEEYEYACSLQNLTKSEYENISHHSDLYRTLLKEGLIKEEPYTDGTKLYDLNIAIPTYARILNEEGFFAIKDTIYQMTPTQLRAWPSCKTLLDTNKVNSIVEFDLAQGTLTKSLFPLHIVNQSVAYAYVSGIYPTDRTILTFYDRNVLAIPNVNREVYIRTSFQRKIGSEYVFMEWPYILTASFDININGVKKSLWLNATITGANDWYSVYFEYEFLNPGKQTQVYSDNYHYITSFSLRTIYTVAHPEAILDPYKEDKLNIRFDGKRESELEGNFWYTPISEGLQSFSPLLPE